MNIEIIGGTAAIRHAVKQRLAVHGFEAEADDADWAAQELRRYARIMGARGGKVKSAAKAEASRKNGTHGGRPKKGNK